MIACPGPRRTATCRFRKRGRWRATKKEGKKQARGGRRLEGKEAKECLMNHPIFLARKQNLLEVPTQQMCAYVCLAQLAT